MSFDVSADAYTRFMGRYSEPLAARFADLAGVRPGQRALDVGCGPGALTAELAGRLGAGEVCAIDELYVEPEHRGRRHATRLLDDLAAGTGLWSPLPVALALEVTPNNVRARRLYERAGFRAHNLAMRRRLSIK